MGEVYVRGDPAALAAAWAEGRRHPLVGPMAAGVELFYPVGRILSLAAEIDRRIGRDGLAAASRWLLDTWVPGWRAVIPPATAEILAAKPVLVYGNHPSLLTPFLVGATVPRPDLKIVSASFLDRLLPSYACSAFSVELPVRNWGEHLRRGGVSRLLLAWLIGYLTPPQRSAARKEGNRHALAAAAAHLRSGGALLIAPAGWTLRPRPWLPGIGRIVQALERDPGPDELYLVPFREEHTSDARTRAVLGRGPVARLKRRFLYRQPVTIRYGPPTPCSALAPLPGDVPGIVRLLQTRYEALFRQGT